MNCTRIAVCVVAWILVPTAARSAVTSIVASKDNSIYQNSVNNSAGGAAGIFAGGNGSGSPRRGLLAFDVAGNLPAGVTITNAFLGLTLGNAPNTSQQVIELHRMLVDWGEGTAGNTTPTVGGGGNGFAAGVGDATWNTPTFGSGAWSNPGATGDFVATASASNIVFGSVETFFSWNSPALLSDVQGWYASPASNFGWLLLNAGETTAQSVKAFYSRSATQNASGGTLNPEFRPRLIITYVPEPATVALLLIAGPLVCPLRRR
jgi:hypothetical protein